MYRYKNSISVFTICYTSQTSIYTHQGINGAFIYSTYILAAVVLLYSPFFAFFLSSTVWNRPQIQRPSSLQSRSRLRASSCDHRASTFRLWSRTGTTTEYSVPFLFWLLSFSMG